MNTLLHRRLLLICALLLALTPVFVAVAQTGSKSAPDLKTLKIKVGKTQHFHGKVVFLKDLLANVGAKLEPEASPHWVALVTDDGKIYPLIKDAGAKMFFTDAKVRNRPMRLTGQLIGESHLLQVLDVRSVKDGKLHDIYYWCDICQIRRNAGGICECCGDPMHLREKVVNSPKR